LIQRTSNWITGDFTENRVMISFGAQLAPAYKGDPSAAAPFNSDWGLSGFYTGVQMGVGTLATALNGPRGPGTNTSDFGNEGFQGGAFLGYGLTLNHIYLGLEFDGEGGDQTWKHDGTGGTRVYSVRKRGSYEAAARLGYELDNQALVYGRFGVVTSRFETSYTQGATTTVKDEQQRGLRYGAGTDFPITGNFFGRMEYTYTSYADYDMPTATGADNFANSESLMRFGIGFRFNRGPEKVKTPTVDYNGFYVGLQGGHGSLTTDNAGLRTAPQTLSVSRSGFGTGGGIFGGYGHAFGPVYLGGDLDGDLSNTDW
jgi:opacity protein-like surface antigen